MFRKIITLITVSCFLFSFVLGDALHAAIVPPSGTQAYEKAINGFVIPYTFGRITGAQGGSGPVVIHIQDLHCHPEVQRNIGHILSLLDGKYGPLRVYVEGAAGNVDTRWLSGIRDEALKKRIADSLLSQGKLTGAEYYAAFAARPLRITGLEDRELYAANVRRLSRLLAENGRIAAVLDGMRGSLDALKKERLGARNRRVEQAAAKYREGEIDSGKYHRLLRKYAQNLHIEFAGYTSINEYVELSELGEKLNYPKIAAELHGYVAYLRRALPYASYNLLLTRTGNFTRLEELYAALAALSKDPALAAALDSRYPHLARFLDYVALSQRINPVRLLQEEKALLRLIRGNLSLDRSEREIVFLDDFFDYLSSYYSNKLTAEEYGYYRDNVGRFTELWAKYADTGMLEALEPYRGLFADYYETNLRRNEAFLNAIAAGGTPAGAAGNRRDARAGEPAEILAALPDNKGAVVVISGGFHTDGLARLLGDRGYCFLTITPNVTGNTTFSDAVYDGLIRHQSTFLSQALGAYLLSLYPDSELGLKLVEEAISAEILALGPRFSAGDVLSEEQVRRIEDKVQNDVLHALGISRNLDAIRFELFPAGDGRHPFSLTMKYRDTGEERTLHFVYDLASRSAARTDWDIPTAGISGKDGEEETPGDGIVPDRPSRLPRKLPLRQIVRRPGERKLWNLYGKELLDFSKQSVRDLLARYPAQTEQDRDLDKYIETVLESKEFRRMMYVSQGLQTLKTKDPKRMHHIIEVTKTAAQLAERLHMNVRTAMLLALLHDLGHPVLGHVAEKMNNYGTAGQFTHNYSHDIQGAVLADHMFRDRMPDELLELLETGISRHSDKANRVQIEGNRFGSPEGILLMYSDAIAGVNTDLRLAVKYGYTTVEEMHAALPELDAYRGYTFDELADKVTEMLMDDLVRSSDRVSVGFSREMVPFYAKVKAFILTNYIAKDKDSNELWRASLLQILEGMTHEEQIVFLRTANDTDLRAFLEQNGIPIPQKTFDNALASGIEESPVLFIRSLMLESARFSEGLNDKLRRRREAMDPREGLAVLRARARMADRKRREARQAGGVQVHGRRAAGRETTADPDFAAIRDFAAQVGKSAPEELEPHAITRLTGYMDREDLEYMSYYCLNNTVRDISRKRPDLFTPSLLGAVEAALSRQKDNETNIVFLASALRVIVESRPALVEPSTPDTLREALQAQDRMSEHSLSTLSKAVASLAEERPELLDRALVETLGATLERMQTNEAVVLRVCEALDACMRARKDLAITALGPLEDFLASGTAGDRACKRIAEMIMEVSALNPDIVSAATFNALESVMMREQLDPKTYTAVSAAIKAIARYKWQLIGRTSLTRVVISQPDYISWHPLPHYRVYFNVFFDMMTANMAHEDRYSIALSAWRLLMRMNVDITDGSIEKAVRFILRERARVAEHKIFAGGVSVVNIFGREDEFDPAGIVEFERGSGVGKIASFKGDGNAETAARVKSEALDGIAKTRGPLTVYVGAHGSAGYLWLDAGQRNAKRPDYTQAISYQELGDALLERGDLERVNLLIDACYAYDFCTNLMSYLALKGSVGSPVLVVSSNMDQPSHINLFKEGLLSMSRPSGVCLKDVIDIEKKAFRYQDGAVFVPADMKALASIFGLESMDTLPDGSVQAEIAAAREPGTPDQAYSWLPRDVVEIGLIPWLWDGMVSRLQGLTWKGKRLVPAPVIGALGGFEEVIFGAAIVGGLGFLLGLIGIDHTVAVCAASLVSAVLFPLAHVKGVYGFSESGLTRAPPAKKQLVSIAFLGISLRLIFAAGLLGGWGLPASLLVAGLSHSLYDMYVLHRMEKAAGTAIWQASKRGIGRFTPLRLPVKTGDEAVPPEALGAYLLSLYPDSGMGRRLMEEAISAEIASLGRGNALSEEQLRQVEQRVRDGLQRSLKIARDLAGIRFEMSPGADGSYSFKLTLQYRSNEEKTLNFVYDTASRTAARTDKEIPTTGVEGDDGQGRSLPPWTRSARGAVRPPERKLWNLDGRELLAFSKDTVRDLLARYPAQTEQDQDLDKYIGTVLESKEFRRMMSVSQGLQTTRKGAPKRLHHIIEVTKTAAQLAERLHMNVRISVLLALLHDLGHPVLGHIAEKVNNYGAAGLFTHSYSHNHQGAVITDHMFRGRMPDDLLKLLETGISRHSDKANQVDLAANRFGSPEGVLLMFSDAIAGINTDLRLAVKYGYVTLEEMHAALPELDAYRDYTIDELADKVTEMLMDDLVRSSNRGTVGFSRETAPFYNKVKSFILANYIGKASHKENDDQWRDSLIQILQLMTVDQQVVFLRSANDVDLRRLFRQYQIPMPKEDITDPYLLSGQDETDTPRIVVLAPRSVRYTVKAVTLMAARLGEGTGDRVRRTMSPREGFDILRARAQERGRARNAAREDGVRAQLAEGNVKNFAAEVQQSAPETLEPHTVSTLEGFLAREDLEHISYYNLNAAVRDIARKRPDLLTSSLLDALEAALSRQRYNETNTVFLASSIDEIVRAAPALLQPSTLETLRETLESQDDISEHSFSALSDVIAGIVGARPELLDRTVIETLGETLERLTVNENVSLRLCEALGACMRARKDLAIAALAPLENVLRNGTAGSRLCERSAEVIMAAGALNPDIVSPATFAALESVMMREQLDLRAYTAVSAAIKALARDKWQLVGRSSLTRVVLSQPDHIAWHPLPHYRVYLNVYFDMATANLPPEDRYSIALSAWRLLKRMKIDITDHAIEKAVRFVMAERARVAGHPVFAGGVSAINIIGREDEFEAEDIVQFEQNSGVGKSYTFKGSGDAAEIARLKAEALDEIARTRGPLTVYFGGHGAPGYLWIDSSRKDSKHPDYSQAISYPELGDALLARGDIGRVTLLIDACYSYDFCAGLLAYLADKGAAGAPVLIASSNLDQPSRLNLFKEGLLSVNRPSGVCLKDVFDAEKKAFRYQDGAVFVPSDMKTLATLFGPAALRALPARGVHTEFMASNISGAQSQAYYRLPGDVAEIGMIPWLWQGLVKALQKLSWKGRRLVPDRAIAALGGLEEVVFSAVLTGGLSALLSAVGLDPKIALAASSVLSFILFQAAHLKGNYALAQGRLEIAPSSKSAQVRTALLGGALRLIYAASLAGGIGALAALGIAVAAHGAFNALGGLFAKTNGLLPRRTANALDDPSLSSALNAFVKESTDPRSPAGATIREETSAARGMPLDEYSRFLRRLGARAGLSGSAVYYPFGGFDPYTAFSLVPTASDVFSVGLDDFGSARDLAAFFEQGAAGNASCWQFRQYDRDSLKNDLGIASGLGALAAARIAALLKGRITRISYFTLDRDGGLVFAGKGDSGFRNAVIEFTDPSGRTKRFWYFQDNVYDPSTSFARFTERDDFEFQTLLIKGAPGIWDSGRRTEAERDLAIRKTFAPALRNHAGRGPVTVFTDKRNASPRLVEAADGMRPVWQPGYGPNTIRLAGGESFGYSVTGCVYYGPADRLVREDTPTGQITNYGAQNDDEEDYFVNADAFEEPNYYYLFGAGRKDDLWRERFGDDVSFSENAGLFVEAVREGSLGEFRIKEDMPPAVARRSVIEFIGSLQEKIKDMLAEVQRLAGSGQYEKAAQLFAKVQEMDPFAAIEHFDPAAVAVDGNRIVTGIGQEEDFTDGALSRKERLAQYEKGILRFARSYGVETRLDGVMDQLRFGAQNVGLIVSSIRTMNASNWKDKVTKIAVGLLFLGTQVVPPMVRHSFDDSTGNITKMEMFRPSHLAVTMLDLMAAANVLTGTWPTAIGFLIGSLFIRRLSRGMRGHELTHFYQHLVVHRMHQAGLVSSENKLPLNVFEVPATPVKHNAPSRAQFNHVTASIVKDALAHETGSRAQEGALLAKVARALGKLNIMKLISGAFAASVVDRARREHREVKDIFPALWDSALYVVGGDLDAGPARRWLAEANAAGIPGAAITLLPRNLSLEGLSELGKVLVSVPGQAAAAPVAVYAGTAGSRSSGKNAVLYLDLQGGAAAGEEFLGRAARAVMAELAGNPRFRERLKDLFDREGLLDGRDIGQFDFKPGAVLLDGDEALAAAVPASSEDVLENPFPAGAMFAYVPPAVRKGQGEVKKAARLCDALLDGRADAFAALSLCQQALEAKQAEGALKGCDIIARVIVPQLLPDSYGDDSGTGKLTYLKNEIVKARTLGANNVLLEHLFNEEFQSAVHEYLVDWRQVPEVSGDPEFAKKADALTAGGAEREAEAGIAGALAASAKDLKAAARFAGLNADVAAYAAARGESEQLRSGFACAQMHAYRQLKNIIDLAHKNDVRLHREFTASDGNWAKVRGEVLFWLNTGIEGSKFDGARLDLSAVKNLSAADIEELAASLRQGVLVTVVLPENSSRELAGTCRAAGFKVVRTYVAGAERTQGTAGDNECAELHVPAAGLFVDSAKLKAYLDSWKSIPADVLSMQMDILEGGSVSEDPARRNPQRERNIPALDARKMLALLKIGSLSGRRTAWGLAEKSLPEGAGALAALLDIIRIHQSGDISRAAGCDAVFAAARSADRKGAIARSAPVVWHELEKLSRQGEAADAAGEKQELARQLGEFARGVAERMLLKESKGDVRFADASLDGEFAQLLLKGELAFAAYLDGSGVAAGVTDARCMQLLKHLLVLRRYREAGTVMLTLASRYNAALDAPGFSADRQWLETALQWVAVLDQYAGKTGSRAFMRETVPGSRISVQFVAEKVMRAAADQPGLQIGRYNAACALAALTGDEAFEKEALALEKEVLAAVPETAAEGAAFLDAVAESGLRVRPEIFGRAFARLRLIAKQTDDPEAIAATEWALDLYADKKVPELKAQDLIQPAINTLSVAGIRGAA